MSFEFEHKLNYPLAGATGYDVDDTLIAIRAIEQDKEWVAENCSPQFIYDSWDELGYGVNEMKKGFKEFTATLHEINSKFSEEASE